LPAAGLAGAAAAGFAPFPPLPRSERIFPASASLIELLWLFAAIDSFSAASRHVLVLKAEVLGQLVILTLPLLVIQFGSPIGPGMECRGGLAQGGANVQSASADSPTLWLSRCFNTASTVSGT